MPDFKLLILNYKVILFCRAAVSADSLTVRDQVADNYCQNNCLT